MLLLFNKFFILVVFFVSVVRSRMWFDSDLDFGNWIVFLIFFIGFNVSCFMVLLVLVCVNVWVFWWLGWWWVMDVIVGVSVGVFNIVWYDMMRCVMLYWSRVLFILWWWCVCDCDVVDDDVWKMMMKSWGFYSVCGWVRRGVYNYKFIKFCVLMSECFKCINLCFNVLILFNLIWSLVFLLMLWFKMLKVLSVFSFARFFFVSKWCEVDLN